jgi:hypothetical protein
MHLRVREFSGAGTQSSIAVRIERKLNRTFSFSDPSKEFKPIYDLGNVFKKFLPAGLKVDSLLQFNNFLANFVSWSAKA